VVSTLQKQIKQYITSCSGIDVKEVKVEVETASIKAEKSPYSVPDSLMQTTPKVAQVETPPAPRPVQTIDRNVVQMERPAQPPERQDRVERSNRPEKSDRNERSARSERSERSERPERPERVERIERVVTPPVNSVQPAVSPVQQPAPQVMQRMQADLKGPSFPEPVVPAVPAVPVETIEEKKRPLHQRLFGHKEQPAIVPMPPELERKAEFADEPMMFDMQEDADSAHEALEAQEGEDHEEH
jgi:hypothetical protein